MSSSLLAACVAACLVSTPMAAQVAAQRAAPDTALDAAPAAQDPAQAATPAAGEAQAGTSAPAPWLDAEAVARRLAELAAAHADLARVDSLGITLGGRPILALVIRAGERPLADRQGLLIVGGLDGRRATDANVLLAAADALLADAAGDLRARLGEAAVVIVPRANPDGAQALAGASGVRHEQAGNGRPDDRDRDGRGDEDGPVDLDGDGLIAWMAVPDGEGGYVFDEHDPRALRHARPERGERGSYRLLLEGRDADGDGAENEDDGDGVQPDANFPRDWREFAPEAGRYPLSEPESVALAEFVLDHPRLQAVLVVGAQDTLVSLPKAAGNAPGDGSLDAPLDGVHADDAAGLKELQRRLVALGKAQGHEHAVKGDGLAAGSFLAWTYHQAGRWPLALKTWTPPAELPKPDKAKVAQDTGKSGESGESGATKDAAASSAPASAKDGTTAAEAGAPEAPAAAKGAADQADKDNEKDKDKDAADDDKPASDAESPAPAAVLAWLTTERAG
ncbi:MAG TPA: M14 family zinc carboxypeptidase, partial [Planctomycetota bacterium]|nr:M14 family zinc carboxypeptidase [Planctomycetota bacterium]